MNSVQHNWMSQLAEEATVDMVHKLAGLFAEFYHGLRARGLSERAAVTLTQTYIAATITPIMTTQHVAPPQPRDGAT